MRYFIRLSYKGTHYNGWQIQHNAPSVQAELSNALSLYLGEPISLCGAGRTDTGVHAINFIAHFDSIHLDLLRKHSHYAYKLNAILPPDICVHAITSVLPQAHARFDALSRTYLYIIHFIKNPFIQEFSAFCPYPLNMEKMNNAASLLLGNHDFSPFSKLHGGNKTSFCTISHALFTPLLPSFSQIQPLLHPLFSSLSPQCSLNSILFTIKSNRFLRNMVRAIVGTLISVGRGKIEPEDVVTILQKKERSAASTSASAQGLFLCQIEYPYTVY